MATGLVIFISLIVFIGLILFLTMVHELGHFAVAKWSGARVAEFSIGFGPKIVQVKKGDTTYSLRWLPFGGYVSVLSDDTIEQIEMIRNSNPTEVEIELLERKMYGLKVWDEIEDSHSIDKKSYPVKLMFTLGGVFMNFMAAWIALFVGYLATGKETYTNTPQIAIVSSVNNNSYGFQIEKLAYNTNPSDEIEGMDDIFYFIKDQGATHSDVTLTLTRINENGVKLIDKEMDIKWLADKEKWNITKGAIIRDETGLEQEMGKGMDFTYYNLSEGVTFVDFHNGFQALGQSFVDSWKIIGEMFVMLFDIMTLGMVVDTPEYGIAFQGEESFNIAYNQWSMLFVDLSMILFAFNIIPLPPLDGWKATEYTYEIITKKKIDREVIKILTYLGYGFIGATFFFSFLI